jgi:methylmalonic aciduria homocystinuria type C protein
VTVAAATRTLADAGFDIVHPFDAAAVARDPMFAMLADTAPVRRLGLLIGNTRALWPPFTAALRADPALAASSDPLDRYTERLIERATAALPDAWWRVGHVRYDGAFVPLQRLAVATGLGMLAPTQLVIHPVFGPWFALRAVIVCRGDAPTTPITPTPCRCTGSCEAALARALATTGPETWRAWVAVRDACSVGREHRYGDEQLRYHYQHAFRPAAG